MMKSFLKISLCIMLILGAANAFALERVYFVDGSPSTAGNSPWGSILKLSVSVENDTQTMTVVVEKIDGTAFHSGELLLYTQYDAASPRYEIARKSYSGESRIIVTKRLDAITNWRENAIRVYAETTLDGGGTARVGPVLVMYSLIFEAPLLLSPADDANGVSLTPTFNWLGESGSTTSRIQVATTANFSTNADGKVCYNCVINEKVDLVNRYQAKAGVLDADTTYYWRVRTGRNVDTPPNDGKWSMPFHFTTKPEAQPSVSVSLVAPHSGTFEKGEDVTIEWTTTGLAADEIMTLAMKRDSFSHLAEPDGENWFQFPLSHLNTGSYEATIPFTVAAATDWRFYIKHNDSGEYAASDEPITIQSLVTLTAPHSGTFQKGEEVTVEWTTTGLAADEIMTLAMKRDSFSHLTEPDGKNWFQFPISQLNSGSYAATIPSTVTAATDWRFYVKHNDSGDYAASNEPITIGSLAEGQCTRSADPYNKWMDPDWIEGPVQILLSELRDGKASHSWSPAELIYYSAKENDINPVLLLAKLQDEQSLLTQGKIYGDTDFEWRLLRATGYGAKDSGDMTDWYGFYPQLVASSFEWHTNRTQNMSFQKAYEEYTSDDTKYDGFVASCNNGGIYACIARNLNAVAGTSYAEQPESSGYYNDFKDTVTAEHIQMLLETYYSSSALKNENLFKEAPMPSSVNYCQESDPQIDRPVSGAFPETAIKLKTSQSPYAEGKNAFTVSDRDLKGQCTWYAYARVMELVESRYLAQSVGEHFRDALWGKTGRDAKNWPNFLGGEWTCTTTEPLPMEKRRKGLIAVWKGGTHGHVGFVEEVSADKTKYRLTDFNYVKEDTYADIWYEFEGPGDMLLGEFPCFYELELANPEPVTVYRSAGDIQEQQTVTNKVMQIATGKPVTVRTNWPGSDVDLLITTPSGQTIDRTSDLVTKFYDGDTQEYYVLDIKEEGIWTIDVVGMEIAPEGEHYTFDVTLGENHIELELPPEEEQTDATLSAVGAYLISDSDGDGFSETLTFETGMVPLMEPSDDGLFSDMAFEQMVFADLLLDPDSFTSGSVYNFAQTMYADGFALYDDDQSFLMGADLSVSALEVDGSTGRINSEFGVNLTNFEVSADYISGTSEIIDQFLSAGLGAINFTLQFAGQYLGDMIESGQEVHSTWSGSASTADPVPEPSTVMLLGLGLFGILAFQRKNRKR